MKYIQGTIVLPLTLTIDNYFNIKCYVDAAFLVHKDMRSHTGGFVTMGTRGAYVQSSKKINTNSPTQVNIVGVDDLLTQVVWTQYFLKYQRYQIHDNIIYQDNQSVTKIENHGRKSISKRIRHVNTRYYFITDSITNQKLSMDSCTTLDMIRDYFMKTLHGSQFRRFRNIIIGIHEDDIPSYNVSRRSFLEEIKIKLDKEK